MADICYSRFPLSLSSPYRAIKSKLIDGRYLNFIREKREREDLRNVMLTSATLSRAGSAAPNSDTDLREPLASS